MSSRPIGCGHRVAAVALIAMPILPLQGHADQTATSAVAKPPIEHVVIIVQENRSFDSYFGTFPNAKGIPAGTCVPLDPVNPRLGCVAPFHDARDVNADDPHDAAAAQADLDDGISTAKMDGFIINQTNAASKCTSNSVTCFALRYGATRHDAVGFHTREDIPNYWEYATYFVLQDRMFAAVRAWSYPGHLQLVSEWVATCTNNTQALSCKTALPNGNKAQIQAIQVPWASLFQLMDVHGVSWKYYLGTGVEPNCIDAEMTCAPAFGPGGAVPLIWNPMPSFLYIKDQGGTYLDKHNSDINHFLADLANRHLPQVSWIVPNWKYSEHPPFSITAGMEYVTSLVNAIMESPYWTKTAIFITWDDWGGFYDHVVPPNVDTNTSSTPI